MAEGGGCRDEQFGSSASEVGTDDGTAKIKNKNMCLNTVNSLASSPPEHSTEAVPFYPTPSGFRDWNSLQGCSRGDDC